MDSLRLLLCAAAVVVAGVPAVARVVFPREIHEPLHNPHMGWGVVAYLNSPLPGDTDPYPWYDNVQVLFTWAAVEREPGEYDWSTVDRVVEAWTRLGKTIHIIASTECYGQAPGMEGCPDWLYALGVPCHAPQGSDGPRYPDYTHPLYQQRLRLYLKQFADHFCNDPRVELIALRGYGAFGEWHSGYPYRTVAQRRHALRTVFDLWREAIAGRRILTVSVSYEWEFPTLAGSPGTMPPGTSIYDEYRPSYRQYLERSLFDEVFDYPAIAARRDGVGGAVFQEWDGRLLANLSQHWRRPIWAEPFGGYEAYTGPSPVGFPNTRPGDDFLENAVDEALSHHANYLTMHWGDRFQETHPELVAKAQRLLGYRFVLVRAEYPETVEPGGQLVLGQTWENRGMGRCYRRYPLAVYLMQGDQVVWQGIDADFDQTNFVAGESYEVRSCLPLPADLPEGAYDLRLAMVDHNGTPRLRLAVGGRDASQRYLLGPIRIGRGRARRSGSAQPLPSALVRPGQVLARPGLLRPWRTYLLSFRYDVTANPERDLNSDDPGYFACYAEGGDGLRVGETRWYDKAGQGPARKTILLALRERDDYQLVWEALGGGAMVVDDVHLEAVPDSRVRRVAAGPDLGRSVAEDLLLFGGATAFDRRRPPCPLPIVVASRDASQVRLPADDYDFMATNPAHVPLEPDTVYTVWFTCSARPQVGQGDHLYLRLVSEGHEAEDGPRFMWTQRHTTGPVRRAYTFRTGAGANSRLVWGLRNGGYAEISNVVILRR